ncbi:divalent-cation tolerance protein CutA [Candidatus Woesearchaeota archaeon]|nr:MAG: divalent-cation tolerance protein CutA [Candidatus Woesearchaeota archaeon]
MANLSFIYITAASKEEAKKIAGHLLKKKLIGCANIYENVTSLYPWKGKVAEEKECVLIAKTVASNYEKVKKEVEKIHSYTTPCIIKIDVDANKKYADWLKKEMK